MFIGLVLSGFGGRFLGFRGVTFVHLLALLLTFLVGLFMVVEVCVGGSVCYLRLFEWLVVGSFVVEFGFLFDQLSVMMLVVVVFVSLMVHFYSVSYMSLDAHYARFFFKLSLFTFCMMLLVTSGNLVQFLVGWEAVGLSSYLLINFWYTRVAANKAGLKALLLNRVGDCGLMIGVGLVYYYVRSVDFLVVFSLVPLLSVSKVSLICLFLVLGVVGKSAQLGLHTWLPDAMEGPTPVSALIHAATMVTAGVYLLLRCSPVFEFSGWVLQLLVFLGVGTAVLASLVGLFQYDIKKIIAFSTCAQLGYMVFACGLSNYVSGFYHLVTHACFKALLFLCAGAVIHAVFEEQDIRRMGNLLVRLPLTYILMLIGTLALVGFPFLAGFYSKDAILEVAVVSEFGFFVYWFGLCIAFLTSFYSFKLIYFVFLASPGMARGLCGRVVEGDWFLWLPLLVLALVSVIIGYILRDVFVGCACDFWGQSLFCLEGFVGFSDYEFLPYYVKMMPLFSMGYGLLVVCVFDLYMTQWGYMAYLRFVGLGFYWDVLYAHVVGWGVMLFGYCVVSKALDSGFFYWFLVGVAARVRSIGMVVDLPYRHGGFGIHFGFFVVSFLTLSFCVFLLL